MDRGPHRDLGEGAVADITGALSKSLPISIECQWSSNSHCCIFIEGLLLRCQNPLGPCRGWLEVAGWKCLGIHERWGCEHDSPLAPWLGEFRNVCVQ